VNVRLCTDFESFAEAQRFFDHLKASCWEPYRYSAVGIGVRMDRCSDFGTLQRLMIDVEAFRIARGDSQCPSS
jgi:hypothetical protein